MIKLDLITGFLGSGKTTFIQHYAKHLLSLGQRIAILENDYGAINVDMMLLKELEGKNCDLEMVVGGNDYDCHKRRFKSKLIALGMLGYDRVIVEPSGIFDVDEFFDVLHEEPIDRWYEIGSVIAVVDATMKEELSHESDYLLVSQCADAGKLLLSKTDRADENMQQETVAHLNRAMEAFGCKRRILLSQDVIAKPWDDYTDEDYLIITEAGISLHDHIKLLIHHENDYQSLFYMNVEMTPKELHESITSLMKNEAAGDIIRIKGFLKCRKDAPSPWLEINATQDAIEMKPSKEGQEVLIVIGENLNRDVIGSYWKYEFGTGRELLPSN